MLVFGLIFGLVGGLILVIGLGMGFVALIEPGVLSPLTLIALVFIPMGSLFVGIGAWSLRSWARAKRLRETGLRGTATIMAAADTGIAMNHNPVGDLDLEVHVQGRSPYRVRHRTLVPAFAARALDIGVELPVWVDPAAPRQLALEWRPLPPRPEVPATFGDEVSPLPGSSSPLSGDISPYSAGGREAAIPDAGLEPAYGSLPASDAETELVDPDELREVLSTSLRARATIDALEPTGVSIRGDPVFRFQLSIRAEDSNSVYRIRPATAVPEAAVGRLAEGASFPARVDRTNPSRVAVDWIG